MLFGSSLKRSRWRPAHFLLLAAVFPSLAFASGDDPSADVALKLALLLVGARLAGHLASMVHQPAVLGELLFGVVLGNLKYLGVPGLESIAHDPNLDMLGRLGVLILLFEVGLESTVKQMLQVGLSALLVATVGVVVPFVLGFGVAELLIPEQGHYVAAFLGATLTATSVGITARVLQELGASSSAESRVILGAAVLDDVFGLVILAVVSGVIAAAGGGAPLSGLGVAGIVAKAAGFLVVALAVGVRISPRLFRVASRIEHEAALLAMGLGFCFLLSWAAAAAGLAPIVGAFAAGLILEDVHYQAFVDRGEHGLEELVKPLTGFLTPVFFVLMGMHTDLPAMFAPSALLLGGALVVAAVVGKQACALGVLQPPGQHVDRITVGLGMIPRGEVGLIFASIGAKLQIDGHPVISTSTYAAVVAMVILTTMATPPLLTWRLRKLNTPAVVAE